MTVEDLLRTEEALGNREDSDPLREREDLIQGSVVARSSDELHRARDEVNRLFVCTSPPVAAGNPAVGAASYHIPPTSKPDGWAAMGRLPSLFTVTFSQIEDVPIRRFGIARPVEPLMLSLSGGGFRATLFHLGMLTHLAQQNRLRDVQLIVSVSGGSILAAHFAQHWQRAIESEDGFIEVTRSLIEYCRSGVRDRVLTRFIWSRFWLLWLSRRLSRTALLEADYERHFGSAQLGELQTAGVPRLAIVSTDIVKKQRVAFTADRILRIPIEADVTGNNETREPILATGVRLATAVAASSCFPPVFGALTLGHDAINLNYNEFMDTLVLKDGGIAGNLGVEVFLQLARGRAVERPCLVVSDAECSTTDRPRATSLNDVDTISRALSEGARERLRTEAGGQAIVVQLSKRLPRGAGLPFDVERLVQRFRTDLDSPSWEEIYAVVLHGACAAANSLSALEVLEELPAERVKRLLISAGAPATLALPTVQDLKQSHLRPKRQIAFQILLALVTALVLAVSLWWAGSAVIRWYRGSSGASDESKVAGQIGDVPNPPPTDFPSFESSGLVPLTDVDRHRAEFASTTIVIENETPRTISLAFGYPPYRGRDSRIADAPIVHRETPPIPPGGILERSESQFGGPVHISVLSDGEWFAMNLWMDFGVVSRRFVTVTERNGRPECAVRFEK